MASAVELLAAWAKVPAEYRELFLSHLSEEERGLIEDNAHKVVAGSRNTRWESPFALQKAIDPKAIPARHFELLGDLWRRAETQPVFATVSIAVRMAKSTQIARYGPAWFLDRNHDKRIVIATNTANLAQEHSRFARSLIVEHPDKFQITVAEDSSAVNKWSVSGQQEGGVVALGAGGAIIGKGYNVCVIDDPYSSYADANSPGVSKFVWEWFTSTILNRAEPGASIFVVMARWNEDDLVGRIHAEMPGEFENISVPAIAVENDVLGREVGEALWPERYDETAYQRIKKMQRKTWACQYQQDVSGSNGSTEISITQMGRWKLHPMGRSFMVRQPEGEEWVVDYPMWRFGTVDWAVGTSDTADFTCFARWNFTVKKNLILEAIHIFRSGDPAPMVAARVKQAGKWFPVVAEAIGIQNKLNRELAALGVPVINANVGARGDKKTRNIDTVLLVNQGRLFCPAPTLLPEEVVRQMSQYPTGDHDDAVDVFSTAANIANEKLIGIGVKDSKRIKAMVRASMSKTRKAIAAIDVPHA